MAGLEAGNFGILGFYARRTLRILPPYFLMLAAVALIAPFVLFVPKAYEIQAKAAVIAPLMASNILFYIEQGYFDPAAVQKPLIHTWTLATEEQFYLVIPIALVLLFAVGGRHFGRRALWITIAVGGLSLAGCLLLTRESGRNPAFYLTYLRAWEFIAGGLILPFSTWLKQRAAVRPAGFLAVLGMALIAASLFGLDGKGPFPGWRAIVPVFGAFLFLAGATAYPGSLTARLLSRPFPVRIGLVSYSWYLWHWPLMSLATLAGIGGGVWRDLLFAGVLGYFAAELSYWFVELPVKRWRKHRAAEFGDRRIVRFGIAAVFLVSAFCGGLTGLGYLRNQAWLERTYGIASDGRVSGSCHVVTSDTIDPECFKGDYVLLFGDSHAGALAPAFAEELEKSGTRLVVIARGGCDPTRFAPERRDAARDGTCGNLIGPFEAMLAAADAPKAAIVASIYSASNYSRDPADFSALTTMFEKRRTAVLFIGPAPIFSKPVLECVVASDRQGKPRQECGIPRSRYLPREISAKDLMDASIQGLPHAAFVPIGNVFCDQDFCRPWEADTLFFEDSNHVTKAGAMKIYAAVKPRLGELLAARPGSK